MVLRALVVALSCCLLACGPSSKKLRGQINEETGDLRAAQAENTARLASIEEQLRRLTGKVEELEFASVGKTRELEQRLRRFGSRVPPPEGVPAELLNADEERISRITGPAADMFRRGLTEVRAGEFEKAERTFSQFVEENPDTAFSDNALFWAGVSAEKLGQYDQAIVNYSDVFERYPAEDRVPAALFRLGETFAKIASYDEGILTFQKLVDDYPRSEFAGDARTRIRDLKRQKRRR